MPSSKKRDVLGSPTKPAKYIVGLDKALSWVVAIAGLALSVWTAVMGDTLSTPWIIGIIAVDSILLVLLGALSAVLFAHQRVVLKRETEGIRNKLDEVEREKTVSEAAHQSLVATKDRELRLNVDLHEEFLSEQASLSRATIEAINEVSEIANEYYEQLDRLASIIDLDKVPSGNDDIISDTSREDGRNYPTIEIYKYCLTNRDESLTSFKEKLFHEHGTFLKEILNTGCQMIRSHLLLRGRDLKVAMCVKLFLEPNMDDELLVCSVKPF